MQIGQKTSLTFALVWKPTHCATLRRGNINVTSVQRPSTGNLTSSDIRCHMIAASTMNAKTVQR